MNLAAAASAVGVSIDGEQESKAVQFFESLYEWNKTLNLTRISLEDAAVLHWQDSLLLSRFLSSGSRVLDVGCGPGFPSWPLACCRPDVTVVALDSSNRPLHFLRTQPLENLIVVQARLEERPDIGPFDVVTGRALAPFPIQMELCCRPANVGGLIAPFRTPTEIGALMSFPYGRLGLELEGTEYVQIAGTEITRLFPLVRKLKKTPQQFPRPWAAIKKGPLA